MSDTQWTGANLHDDPQDQPTDKELAQGIIDRIANRTGANKMKLLIEDMKALKVIADRTPGIQDFGQSIEIYPTEINQITQEELENHCIKWINGGNDEG